MLPPKCITCGKFLADIELDYEELQDMMKMKNYTTEQKSKAQKKFLDEHKIINLCCRTSVITYIDLIKLII
jgi:DNA-directed RNA polymerase subunit N (RpoN/RPB10)